MTNLPSEIAAMRLTAPKLTNLFIKQCTYIKAVINELDQSSRTFEAKLADAAQAMDEDRTRTSAATLLNHLGSKVGVLSQQFLQLDEKSKLLLGAELKTPFSEHTRLDPTSLTPAQAAVYRIFSANQVVMGFFDDLKERVLRALHDPKVNFVLLAQQRRSLEMLTYAIDEFLGPATGPETASMPPGFRPGEQ